MTRTTHQTRAGRRTALPALALAAALAVLGSGCSVVDGLTGPETVAVAAPSAAPEVTVDSQFTRDGTYQSHIDFRGLDLVYTMYPTKATPRTNEWYPAGAKYFSFTFQAYDLEQDLRAPFASKRKVYLDRIRVTSTTTLASGAPGTEQPYTLDTRAQDVTFDPEPLTTPRGMLVTSPKGAFELRNQAIGDVSADTRGVTLTFEATLLVQKSAGSDRYVKHAVQETVPIAIFASEQPTAAQPIPVNAG